MDENVGMSLKMDITLFIYMQHPNNGSSFTSVSTYIQNNRSVCPISNPTDMRLRVSLILPKSPLSSLILAGCLQGLMGIMPLPWQTVDLEFSEGRQLCPL